jgi:SH3-like domain-containing protein
LGSLPLPVYRAARALKLRVVNVPADDVLNIRAGPSARTEIVGTLSARATGISVTGTCRTDWCPVRIENQAGWIHRYFLWPEHMNELARRRLQPIDASRAVTYRVMHVPAGDALNLRREANGSSEIVGSIPADGRKIRMTGYCLKEWCPVSYDGRMGWVSRHFLTIEF